MKSFGTGARIFSAGILGAAALSMGGVSQATAAPLDGPCDQATAFSTYQNGAGEWVTTISNCSYYVTNLAISVGNYTYVGCGPVAGKGTRTWTGADHPVSIVRC